MKELDDTFENRIQKFMDKIVRIETVSEFNALGSHETLHPLVNIIDVSKSVLTPPPPNIAGVSFGFYTVFLKEVKCGDLRYGKNTYDYQEGTLVFIAPG